MSVSPPIKDTIEICSKIDSKKFPKHGQKLGYLDWQPAPSTNTAESWGNTDACQIIPNIQRGQAGESLPILSASEIWVFWSLKHIPVDVDDLVTDDTLEVCKAARKGLLRTLGDLGYCISAKKAQLGQTEVIYLGYIIKAGKR